MPPSSSCACLLLWQHRISCLFGKDDRQTETNLMTPLLNIRASTSSGSQNLCRAIPQRFASRSCCKTFCAWSTAPASSGGTSTKCATRSKARRGRPSCLNSAEVTTLNPSKSSSIGVEISCGGCQRRTLLVEAPCLLHSSAAHHQL